MFISRSAKCRSCRDSIWEANIRAQGKDPTEVRRAARKRNGTGNPRGAPKGYDKKAGNEKARAAREHYARREKEQGGLCAICLQPETETHMGVVKQLARDHNHRDGKLRGLLCRHCNVGIGHLRDDPELLDRAAAYLRSYAT